MKVSSVRKINIACYAQAMNATKNVRHEGKRVVAAKTVSGKLKVKLTSGVWVFVDSVDVLER